MMEVIRQIGDIEYKVQVLAVIERYRILKSATISFFLRGSFGNIRIALINIRALVRARNINRRKEKKIKEEVMYTYRI